MEDLKEMIFIDKYILKFYDELDYVFNSSNNKINYRNCYLTNENYNLTTIIGIQLFGEFGELLSDCIIGSSKGLTTITENSTIIESEYLIICCSNYLFKLSIPNLDLIWKTEVDSMTCFEIFQINEDIIVHGELEISRVSKDGKIIWQKSGRDIWTTAEGMDVFKIEKKNIIATDWEYNQYKIDFDGNILDEFNLKKQESKNSNIKKWWNFFK